MTMREVLQFWKRLAPSYFEDWEERAAIMEYDGGLTREEAEARAYECVKLSAIRDS